MQNVVLDTSIYISAMRVGNNAVLAARSLGIYRPLWLSAVVLEELYAGVDERSRKVVQQLERDFERTRRILVPALSDWVKTGRILSRLGAKYGYESIGRGRLTNDALIAVSAGRSGIVVVTANERDFRRLAEFHAFQWQLVTV
jgi:predicted nucleic acid-binding protein